VRGNPEVPRLQGLAHSPNGICERSTSGRRGRDDRGRTSGGASAGWSTRACRQVEENDRRHDPAASQFLAVPSSSADKRKTGRGRIIAAKENSPAHLLRDRWRVLSPGFAMTGTSGGIQ